MSEQRPVLYHVQVLRLIAAFGILLSHAVTMLGAQWTVFWRVPWSGGVDMFFVISGFIMVYLTQDQFGVPGATRAFLVRRAVRIVPAYWFFTLLLVALYPIIGWQMAGRTIDPAALVASLGFVPWPRDGSKLDPVLAQGWTLNYEIFFYIAFGLALRSRHGLWLLCLSLIVLAGCNPVIPHAWFMLKFWSDPIILCFVGGIVLALLWRRGVRLHWSATSGCVAGGAVVFYLLGQPGVMIAAGIISAGFILAAQPERLGPVRRLLQHGGDVSYTLYLSHTLVLGLIATAWPRIAPSSPWLGVGVGLVASLAFAAGFYRWVERPVTRALHRRFA